MFHIALLAPCFAPLLPVTESPIAPPAATTWSLTDSTQAPKADFNPRTGWYGRLNAGLVTTDDSGGPGNESVEFDEGFLLGAAIGKRVTSGTGPVNVDVDLEGIWTQQDASTSGALQAVDEITVLGALLNVTADIRLAERLSVYVGGGVGPAWMDVGTSGGFHDDDGPFLAWQARGGLEWQFSSRLAATAGYRFLNIDNNNIDDGIGGSSFDLETKQHVLEVGLRFGL